MKINFYPEENITMYCNFWERLKHSNETEGLDSNLNLECDLNICYTEENLFSSGNLHLTHGKSETRNYS